jgi:hypothetical protein
MPDTQKRIATYLNLFDFGDSVCLPTCLANIARGQPYSVANVPFHS